MTYICFLLHLVTPYSQSQIERRSFAHADGTVVVFMFVKISRYPVPVVQLRVEIII